MNSFPYQEQALRNTTITVLKFTSHILRVGEATPLNIKQVKFYFFPIGILSNMISSLN